MSVCLGVRVLLYLYWVNSGSLPFAPQQTQNQHDSTVEKCARLLHAWGKTQIYSLNIRTKHTYTSACKHVMHVLLTVTRNSKGGVWQVKRFHPLLHSIAVAFANGPNMRYRGRGWDLHRYAVHYACVKAFWVVLQACKSHWVNLHAFVLAPPYYIGRVHTPVPLPGRAWPVRLSEVRPCQLVKWDHSIECKDTRQWTCHRANKIATITNNPSQNKPHHCENSPLAV